MILIKYIYSLTIVINLVVVWPAISGDLYTIGISLSLEDILAEYPELPAPKCYHNGPKSFTLMQNAYRASVQSLEHRLQAAKIAKNMTFSEKIEEQDLARQTQPKICQKLSNYNKDIRNELIKARTLDEETISQLKLAYTAASNEAKSERKDYIKCIGKLTTDAFSAFERVRFFAPRMVASGSLEKQDQWIGTIKIINTMIDETRHASGNTFESSLKSFNEATNMINKLIVKFSPGLYEFPQKINSKEAIGWACGTASIAATALLSWTRVPKEIDTTSYDQVKNSFNLIINNSFNTIKSACAFQTGGYFSDTEVDAKLFNTVDSWGNAMTGLKTIKILF
jgi:hypothetical protein